MGYDMDAKKHFLCYFFGRTDYYINSKKNEIELKQKEKDKDKKEKKETKHIEKDKNKDIVHIEDDNILYIGDDDFILTLSNPSYCQHFPCDDKLIERLLVLADSLPKELDELVSFQTSIESKR